MKSRITVPQIAEELGISIPTVYGMLRNGQIPHVRAGKLYIIARPAFDSWLHTCGLAAQQPLESSQTAQSLVLQ